MEQVVASSPEKLKRLTKLAYGSGDLGPAIVAAINGFFLNAFLLDVAGLRPAAAGTIFLLAKLWDAVNDPIVGAISDRTKTRWGRRRPFLLFAAIPFGLMFFLQWVVPPWGDTGKFIYYLIIAILFDTALTFINLPYAALTAELTHDYDERTSLSSYRFSFSILGGVLAAFFHTIIVGQFQNPITGYLISASIWAFVITIPNFITFAFTREVHYKEERPEGPGFLEGLRIAFKNRAFVFVTIIYFLSWLSIQFVQTNLLLYVKYWIGAEAQFGILILSIQVSSFIFLLIWARVSQRIGKQRVYYIGMCFWILVSILLFFVQPGQFTQLYFLAVTAGAGVSIGYLIPWSMLPDVIEFDELETGQRREGIFYGFFVFLQKLGISLGIAISNYILELSGYVNQVPGGAVPVQPPGALLALRVFVSLVPVLILIISFYFVRNYPITRQKHEEMRAELARRSSNA